MENKTRILIVEDEAIVAADLEQQLTALGYEIVALVRSGEECLRVAAELKPDLVLMDINLKGALDGTETASQLRVAFNLPVIFLTALADAATLERATKSEPYGYLVKPFDPRELHGTIRMALFKHAAELDRQRLMRELEEALEQVKTLSGMLPICCSCKKIRDDEGYWSQVEVYVARHSEATFTHGFCPECAERVMKQAR